MDSTDVKVAMLYILKTTKRREKKKEEDYKMLFNFQSHTTREISEEAKSCYPYIDQQEDE